MKPLNPNSMIQGRYLIVQPIGKGGMGEVYLAVDQRLGSAVALKRTFFSDDNALGSAFEREARILARLRHPVLPKVIDHFSENGDQFLVMEHISGDDIAKRLEAANKPFPVSWVMFWSDQMLDALSYLHSHEPPIVHRDIKPQNLKLTDDNHIVLLDFGLSKDFDTRSSGLNSASVAGYSPHFASMEQIRGTGTDARSDLYSLAATLYQMLTNTVPPDALTRADALLGGKVDPIRPPHEFNSEILPEISEVILKAVSIRQEERFPTAIDMQKALRRAFGKEKSAPVTSEKPAGALAEAPQMQPDLPGEPTAAKDAPEMETKMRIDTPIPLDATLQMPSPRIPEVKASEQRTEVFQVTQPGAPTADTRPGISMIGGQSDPEPEPEPEPEVPTAPLVAATAVAAVPVQAARRTASSSPQNKKSKAGLIVGVLVGLFVLLGIGGVSFWYLMTRNDPGKVAGPTPAPANVATPEPTPVLSVANTKTDTNSNAVATTDGPVNSSNTHSNTATSDQPGRPTTPVATKSTPAKSQPTPGSKNTPKPKGKDDRTVILQ